MRHRFLTILVLFLFDLTINGQIELNEATLNVSIASKTEIAEDREQAYSLEQALQSGDLTFRAAIKDIEILDFNSSRWFVRFSVTNPSTEKLIYLETARPITNKVDLHEIRNGEIIQTWKSGDDRPFNQKTYAHRKNIFPIKFKADEKKTFYLVLESDGEVINLPVIFWEKDKFLEVDYGNQLLHGFYFGMLAFVIFIFFIFYLLLKEISFLYYVIYVFFQFMLQFSLEGFTFQYILPNQPYWANNTVLLSAGGAIFFVVLYSIAFLKIKYRIPRWYRIFRVLLVFVFLISLIGMTNGVLHIIAYPAINVLSLFVILVIVYLIFHLKKSGYAINNAFTFGFIILIIGAIIFILGNLGIFGDARLSEMALKISSGLEILALSVSMAGKYRELQREKELAQEKALETLEGLVEKRTEEVRIQKEKIENQNKDILDSIHYAQRIQDAILPTSDTLQKIAGNHFLFYKPRDIVSGDFYFAGQITDKDNDCWDIIAAVDCTGHGVPGAFMSFIGNNLLLDAITKEKITTPEMILSYMNRGLINALKMDSTKESAIRDGMDMSLVMINRNTNTIRYSGAKNSIYWIHKYPHANGPSETENIKTTPSNTDSFALTEIKADKKPIGFIDDNDGYHNIEFSYNSGDRIYLYSDGYPDQFGIDENGKIKKYGSKRFKELLITTMNLNIQSQHIILEKTFFDWKQDQEALDDVLVICLEL